jgi:hypothetical protein
MMKSLFSKLEVNHISKDFDATVLIICSKYIITIITARKEGFCLRK